MAGILIDPLKTQKHVFIGILCGIGGLETAIRVESIKARHIFNLIEHVPTMGTQKSGKGAGVIRFWKNYKSRKEQVNHWKSSINIDCLDLIFSSKAGC